MQVRPVAQIGRAVEKDGAALVPDAGAKNEHPVISFPPDSGIAEASHHDSRRRSCDHRFGALLPSAQAVVLRDSETLHFTPRVHAVAQSGFAVGSRRSDAGVNHRWLALVDDGAAAENAVAVRAAGSGGKSNRFVMPVNHVGAGGMRPIHVAPD